MTTYEGWTNRETWSVNLWLANDEPLYNEVRGMAAQFRKDYAELVADGEEQPRETVYELEDGIRAFVEELVLGDGPAGELGGLRTDLLTGALAQVNWREIAEAWLEDSYPPSAPDDTPLDEQGRTPDEAAGRY